MPSRKGLEQAQTWLRSKMAEGDTLDAINAELCYNVINDLREKRKVIGALYRQSFVAKKRAQERLEELELEHLHRVMIETEQRYNDRKNKEPVCTVVDFTKKELEEIFPTPYEGGDSA